MTVKLRAAHAHEGGVRLDPDVWLPVSFAHFSETCRPSGPRSSAAASPASRSRARSAAGRPVMVIGEASAEAISHFAWPSAPGLQQVEVLEARPSFTTSRRAVSSVPHDLDRALEVGEISPTSRRGERERRRRERTAMGSGGAQSSGVGVFAGRTGWRRSSSAPSRAEVIAARSSRTGSCPRDRSWPSFQHVHRTVDLAHGVAGSQYEECSGSTRSSTVTSAKSVSRRP